MTIAPERPALNILTAAAAELPEPAPAAVTAPPDLSPRPHYIAGAIALGAEGAIGALWLSLRPLEQATTFALLIFATLAASTLVGAAAFIGSGRPLPERKG